MTEDTPYGFLINKTDKINPADLVGRTVTGTINGTHYDKAIIVGAADYGSRLVIRPKPGEQIYTSAATLGETVQVSDEREVPVMTVRVTDRGNGRSYVGVWVTTVTIVKLCSACGGPRGDKRNGYVREDGETYSVDVWDNPCGHQDYYNSILREAAVHAQKEDA